MVQAGYPLTPVPRPLAPTYDYQRTQERNSSPAQAAQKLTHLKKRLPKATKSEQVEMARKIRDITPGAEVVIANWGLAAVDR